MERAREQRRHTKCKHRLRSESLVGSMHTKQVTWPHGARVWASPWHHRAPREPLGLGPGSRWVATIAAMAAEAATVAAVMEHQLFHAFPQPVPATSAQITNINSLA